MPEGDVVLRTARRLHLALAGARLERAELRWGERDAGALVGRTTIEVVARGKHILQRMEGGWTLHSHLRMEGSWRIVATAELTERSLGGSVRAVLGTARWTAYGVRLGMLDLVPTAAEDTLVGHLGPDILGADWDRELALHNLGREPARPIAEALLDQRNLAGIGTLYASESLFLERVHPWAETGSLAPDVVPRVVDRAHRLMHANLDHVVQSSTGSRRPGEESYVHGRSGLPCRRCGGTVRVAPIGVAPQDRVFFSCPACQGGPAPTDDGRPQRPLGTSGRRTPTGTYQGRRRSR